VADLIRGMDDKLGEAKQELFPTLPMVENHYRLVYRVLPKSGKEVNPPSGSMLSHKPLLGTMASLKKRSYETLSDALAQGAELVTYNPVTLFRITFMDDMKLITAGGMWKQLDMFPGTKIWVEKGEAPPAGYVKVGDRISFFDPPESAKRGYKGRPNGSWWVEEGVGTLLNNYVGESRLRNNPIYNGLLTLKDLETSVELVSMFHFMFESSETVSSHIAQAVRAAVNLRDLKMAREALADVGRPHRVYQLGDTLRTLYNKSLEGDDALDAYLKQDQRARELLDRHPDALDVMKILGRSGFRWDSPPGMKEAWLRKARAAFAEQDYAKGSIVSIPAILEKINSPLFDDYIPALKLALALREFKIALQEQGPRIEKGLITEQEVAREVARFIDARFGEMNWDTLWWNPEFKALNRLVWRSITWKVGNLSSMLMAIPEQAKEIRLAYQERRIPILKQKMAWLASMSLFTATLGYAVQKALTGKDPESPKDLIFPRVDSRDDTIRLNLWSYWKDIFHFYHAPANYLMAGISSLFGRIIDIVRNRNYFGEQIHDPMSPWYDLRNPKERLRDLAHLAPTPFATQSYTRFKALGVPPAVATGLGLMGATLAPKDVSLTDAEKLIRKYHELEKPVGGLTADEMTRIKAGTALRQALRSKNPDAVKKAIEEAYKAIGPNGVSRILEAERTGDPLAASVRGFSADQILEVLKVATPDEKKRLARKAIEIGSRAVKQNPMKRDILFQILEEIAPKQKHPRPSNYAGARAWA